MATVINLAFSSEIYIPPPGNAVPLVLGAQPSSSVLVASAFGLAWGRNVGTLGATGAMPWTGRASLATRAVGMPWQVRVGQVVGSTVRMPWNLAARVFYAPIAAPWNRAARVYYAPVAVPWNRAGRLHRESALRWGKAGSITTPYRLPWGRADYLVAPNEPWRILPARGPGRPRFVRLHFCRPLSSTPLRLQLGVNDCPDIPVITRLIPARRTYMQVHTASAVRLPDLQPVTLWGFDLSAEAQPGGAVGWTLSARGPEAILTQLARVSGLPARLRVTLDGQVWEFIVEGLRRTRTHVAFTGEITGRSSSALLAEPYAPVRRYLNEEQMTAEQLIADALDGTGVGVDWRAIDWLVPAGAWSFQGTPMAAVRAVAESIGAVVTSPRTGDNVIVMPRYPRALPWLWASTTPDVIIESLDAVLSEGYERADRPAYEGVYVTGQSDGVRALVKRTGTAPSLTLDAISHPLITHVDAARQRGEAELGAVGPQARMTLSLPVLTGSGEAGVIDPGLLVRVDDPAGAWRGLVRSTQVSVATVDEALRTRQTLTLERHL